jgi:site-specific DNA recombinase
MPISTIHAKSYQSSYTAEIAQSTQLGMRQAAQAGRHSGPIPPGYRKNYALTAIPGVPILDMEQVQLIAKAFSLALEGLTLRTILTQVQLLGLTGRDGKPISLATLARILTNPFYAGHIRYEGKLYPGLHQPLVSETHFKRVQLFLTKRRCS